ncbi:MAG TPA: 2-isopropylmalate synthase [Thermodesulfobacteriota bacterium]|nr:2-isopropylmalate synthase [Deltaproteobacteria bacterium]HNR12973.1 2-isopropylmalate synthase [Thermodesulfobacteriota bacterium]HNU71738.1 2-isopropylmalate synthase [Thermodesulfobacteriota bacterium]HOC38636.1 2-isopropylmalate synthase [Thermodesulfobacteriota bacterium]HQO78208.1 2-isopropylmalate synthase [Thermodesulfobacteriota bacterium]
MENVAVFDTSLRDGEQSPGFSMNIQEKLQVARQLERLNVDSIEAGFPVASDGDFEAVRQIARTIKSCNVAALARANREDIDRAWEAIREAASPIIHTFISTSDFHLKYQLHLSREQVLEKAVDAVKRAKSRTPFVEFSAMDATRTDRDYLCQVVQAAIEAGAVTVNIPDTVGYAIPQEFGALIRYLFEKVNNIDKAVISVHCHNDLGLAVANSLAAVLNGARQVECTINGIGERAGNASMEEIVMSIRTRKDFFNLTTRMVTEQIYATSRLLSQITGVNVQPNKAVVGANAFSHESGIHQDGLLKEKITYEIMTPESIGIPQSRLVLGKHSGRHAFRDRLKKLGYELDEAELNAVFKRFKDLADKKKEVFDEDLLAIIAEETLRVNEKYRLLHMTVASGTVAIPTATVEMEVNGEVIKEAGFGDGPVDAAFKTIAKITGTKSRLLKYAVNAITGGTDAQGEVTVRLEENDHIVTGQGAHTDVIIASAKAYIHALNRLAHLAGSLEEQA